MANKNAETRMEDFLNHYHTLLASTGLDWSVYSNPKIFASQVLAAIKPQSLHDRLEADLDFSRQDQRQDFAAFYSIASRLHPPFI